MQNMVYKSHKKSNNDNISNISQPTVNKKMF